MDILLLKKLVSIPSVFPNELALSTFIDGWILKNIPEVTKQIQIVSKNRFNHLYTKGKGNKSITLIGHLDTVDIANGWKTDPFKPYIKGRQLFGLGAWDMKAGLFIIMQCLKKFNPKNITLKVAFTVDEENYSIGAHTLIKSLFVKTTDFILIPEPGFTHGHHGITIGRTGRSTYKILMTGKSTHGSKSYEGINAILEAQIFINHALKLKFSEDKDFGKTIIYPSAINSRVKGFSVPDECEVELDCKLVDPDTPQIIYNRLLKLGEDLYNSKQLSYLPKISYKKRPTPFCAPYKLSNKNKFIRICEKSVKQITGKATTFYRDTVADECIYVEKLKIPTVSIGPQGSNSHQANENVNLDSIQKVENIYLKIFQHLDNNFI